MNMLNLISYVKLNEDAALVFFKHVEKRIDFVIKIYQHEYSFIFRKNYCLSETENFNNLVKRALKNGDAEDATATDEEKDLYKAISNAIDYHILLTYDTIRGFLSAH